MLLVLQGVTGGMDMHGSTVRVIGSAVTKRQMSAKGRRQVPGGSLIPDYIEIIAAREREEREEGRERRVKAE